ncbi:MAG: molybdopterin cofactor-binding domain-containing protein [Bacteroidia bacterium]|nr:molybdopterin cofactor-binding domain-containing protein [Bacteroidia bacterium]
MKNSNSHTQSRRKFLKNSSGVALFIGASGLIPSWVACKDVKAINKQLEMHRLTAWVQLAEDGSLTIFNPGAEMGQGSMTALPLIFAEEMDADWSKVKVAFSPQEAEIYGSEYWSSRRKIMLSAGSRTTTGYYPVLRKAGAQARHVLMHSAAKKWEVDIAELSTKPGKVLHSASGKEMGYGEILPFLQMPDELPEFSEADLTDPKDFRLIGKDVPRTDIPEKVDGSAKFAIDVRLPNMLYGVYERGKLHGSKPSLQNQTEIEAMPGVVKIVEIEYAIGVIAERLEQALAAKKALKIDWSEATASGFNSQEAYAAYEKIASSNKKGDVVRDIGNFRQAKAQSAKTYTADFKNDYVYHAQMEPLNSVIQVAEDGQSAEVWVGSQQGFTPKMGVPKALGIPPENVKVNLMYLGGGLGRRSLTDFITECAFLAKEVAPRPVKLMWTREDDLTYGCYRPLSLQRLTATTDKDGNLTGLSHYVIGDGPNLTSSGILNEYYDIPNKYYELREKEEGIRLKHWRSVGHSPNKFAIESMIDRVAHDQGVDPVEYRRRLMQKFPKALASLEKAAEIANWENSSTQARAKGVAFLERSGTLSTGICEISVDESTGKIRVHHFWSAHDAGVIVQPDIVKAQIEGGIIMGMSSVFSEQLTIQNGEIQQSNFHDYQLLRMADMPESIETALIDSTERPMGVGESSTPLVACAVANAFFSLTGKRLQHLPFTPERVLEALKS